MASLGTGGKKESTEWDDILRSKGILPEKTPDELAEEVLKSIVQEKVETYDPHENKEVDQLDEELEDADSDEEEILNEYRERRIQQMKQAAVMTRFGPGVQHVPAVDWKAQVTNAGDDVFVVVHLSQTALEECKLMDALLLELSAKFVHTKFVRAKATDAIPNYPDEKCPTLLVYKGGRVLKQFIGLNSFAGRKTVADDIEWELSTTGAVRTDLMEPPVPKERRFSLNRF